MDGENLSELFEFDETNLAGPTSPDDIFSVLEALEGVSDFNEMTPLDEAAGGSNPKDRGDQETGSTRLVSQKSTSSSALQESENELETSQKSKRRKLTVEPTATASSEEPNIDGLQRMSHITVERNRRKQMNEHLTVLRSLMPCFYVKRGDQASIIGGVVDYINELQQVLQSLEAKKQRKVYSEVLSPRLVSSPRSSPLSPRKPPLSPRLSLPISPRTPQPSSPYKPRLQQHGLPSPCSSSTSSTVDSVNELVANSKSAIAEVEVKFSGPNVLLKTLSPRLPGQVVKIVSAIEDLSLEILQVEMSATDQTMINSFTIKIGIECQLSAEELAQQIQQTFC
ncbi:unnamed protein product [Coffea canephora]|uniref:BHLH domain-containing protein n=1 Tax=Coffea canephora TaxID=49390 RepID=A0A068UBR9_COFCA|nr:unnamed protein product [Coffea canephora]